VQRTMMKSKIHRATVNYEPLVVHVNAHNQIINVDREVATLLG
jgi:aspartate 1-decarboxylase